MYDKVLFAEALEKLKKHSSWAIVCHENPDGDTLGCAFALYSLGKRAGKRTSVYSKDPLPAAFSFFPHSDELTVLESLSPEELAETLLVTVDTSTEQRALSNLPELLASCADSLNIDHHGDNKLYAKTNLVDTNGSATAEVMTELIDAFGMGITEGEAAALYTALTTDNGNFKYNSVTPRSHDCAKLLLSAGAHPTDIDDRIHENLTADVLKVWGAALLRTEVFAEGKCALAWLRDKEIKEAEAGANTLEGLVNMLMRIKGVRMGLFVTEKEGCVKLSVRSRGTCSARELASKFGGGGHVNAAGATVEGSFEAVLQTVKKEAEAYVLHWAASGR
ncbi:MAG: bifunctional oligoribonuclease/PAP phosphatase NrnA [Cloacibacillus sp.]